MKIQILLMMMVLLAVPVFSATIIDFDTFETYTEHNTSTHKSLFLNESSKWDCRQLAGFPDCEANFGTGVGFTDYSIDNEATQGNYLSVMALNGTEAGMKLLDIEFSFNDSDALGNNIHNYTIIYDFRLNDYQTGVVNYTANTVKREVFAQVSFADSIGNSEFIKFDNVSNYLVTGQGGVGYTGMDETNFVRLRSKDSSGFMLPNTNVSSNCDITEDVWHNIVIQLSWDSSQNLTSAETFINGTSCSVHSQTDSGIYTNTSVPLTHLTTRTNGRFNVSYDNFYIYDGTVSAVTPPTIYECSDGLDNDGDLFIDYPQDPSCSSADDNTESPFDTTECNDGIDNDLDTFVDYPQDPSCDSIYDSTESPSDLTQQLDSECLISEACLRKDEFLYTDAIQLHNWSGEDYLSGISTFFLERMYEFDNLGVFQFNITTDITNPNNYNDVIVSYDFYYDNLEPTETGVYDYFVGLDDADDRQIILLKYTIERESLSEPRKITVSYLNDSTYYELFSVTLNEGDDSVLRHSIKFDQVLKTFTFFYETDDGVFLLPLQYEWTNIFATKINEFYIDTGNLSSDKWLLLFDSLLIKGDVSEGLASVCDTWSSPYFIVESFNGKANECNWITNLDVYFDGEYELDTTTPLYYQQKQLPTLMTSFDVDYATMTFDLELDNILNTGSHILRLYDDEDFNFLTLYWLDGVTYYYNENGEGKEAVTSIPTGVTYSYKVIIDFATDTYDLWFNGSEVVSNARFTNEFYNLFNIQTVKFQTANSDLTMDDFSIYGSTSDGSPLIPDDDVESTVETDTFMCGRIFYDRSSCIDDDDCLSGICLVNNKCGRLDNNYCEEKGWTYGARCMFGSTFTCGLETVGNGIQNNFFLFIIFLLIVVFLVYISIIFKNRT